MMNITIRKSTESDADGVGNALRQADLVELAALGCFDPAGELRNYITMAPECFTACVDAIPVAMFGIGGPVLASRVQIWLLGTKRMEDYPLALIRLARQYVANKLQTFEMLYNYTDYRHVESIRFLRLVGFRFRPEFDKEVSGIRFRYFDIGVKSCAF